MDTNLVNVCNNGKLPYVPWKKNVKTSIYLCKSYLQKINDLCYKINTTCFNCRFLNQSFTCVTCKNKENIKKKERKDKIDNTDWNILMLHYKNCLFFVEFLWFSSWFYHDECSLLPWLQIQCNVLHFEVLDLFCNFFHFFSLFLLG